MLVEKYTSVKKMRIAQLPNHARENLNRPSTCLPKKVCPRGLPAGQDEEF